MPGYRPDGFRVALAPSDPLIRVDPSARPRTGRTRSLVSRGKRAAVLLLHALASPKIDLRLG
jgi:hypothetical protein